MSAEEMNALFNRFVQICNDGNVGLLEQLYTELNMKPKCEASDAALASHQEARTARPRELTRLEALYGFYS
jgi:hypothetical protein